MQTLSVANNGIAYLWLCFQAYGEGTAYYLLYAASLLYVLLKGNTLEKKVFLPGALCMLVTVYNPIFPVVLNRIFDVNKEYYRFFWISPVVILVSLTAAGIVGDLKGKRQILAGLLVMVMLVLCGKNVYYNGYVKAPNLYKMPTEIPQISEMIHKDSKVEYPRAIFEYDYQMSMRQYDAQILLTADREQYIDAVSGRLDLDTALEEGNYIGRVLVVVALGVRIDKEEFQAGLENTSTEYVVVTTGNPITSYLEACGLTLIGQTANHSVYHYELKNPSEWVLPDYSEVWANY